MLSTISLAVICFWLFIYLPQLNPANVFTRCRAEGMSPCGDSIAVRPAGPKAA